MADAASDHPDENLARRGLADLYRLDDKGISGTADDGCMRVARRHLASPVIKFSPEDDLFRQTVCLRICNSFDNMQFCSRWTPASI
jgi:hypothetical protein